jgi:hypothetical protein
LQHVVSYATLTNHGPGGSHPVSKGP